MKGVKHLRCNTFTPEDYQLYALGVLEGPASALIQSHVSEQCESCLSGVRQSTVEWSLFGMAMAEEFPANPSRALRGKITAISAGEAKVSWLFNWAGWRMLAPGQLALGLGTLVLAASAGWYISYSQQAHLRPVAPIIISKQVVDTEAVRRLESELRAANEQRENALRALALREGQTKPRGSDAAPQARLDADALRATLTAANSSIKKLQESLVQQRSSETRLNSEIAQQRSLLAAATLERDRARASVVELRATLVEREQQVTVLNAKLQQLNRDRLQLQQAAQPNPPRLDQNLRFAALLSSRDLKLVKLNGTEAAPGALAYVFLADGNKVIFSTPSLPDLPPGKVYQLWLMRGRNPGIVSAGTFRAVPGQPLLVEFANNASMMQDIRAFAVTDEPLGGSPLPTGHKFLAGTVKS